MLINRRSIKDPLEPSEYIITDDDSIYHIGLRDEHIADTVIVVGDQNRVERISSRFSSVETKIENREFVTHIGEYNGKRLTVLSTGIGADNVDIVVNELDAAINIDPKTRLPKKKLRSLDIVRLGTSGALQKDIPVDSYVISTVGLGFDGVAHFYQCKFEQEEEMMKQHFMKSVNWDDNYNRPYFVLGNEPLLEKLRSSMTHEGITITANGFYGPQGRALVIDPKNPNLNNSLRNYQFNESRIVNYEMETAALYALSSTLGHRACTICAIIANREARKYSADYKSTVEELIDYTLDRLTK